MKARPACGYGCLLAAALILLAGSLQAEDWKPVSVDDKGKGVYVDRDRIFRVGSFVTLFMRETVLPEDVADKGALRRDIALRIDCGKPEALVAYGDVVFKDGSKLRFFGESQLNKYAKPARLPFIATSLIASLQRDLCAAPRETLVELARDAEDTRTQLNIASMSRSGDEVRAWLRYDYPVIALDMPYRNPYGSKRKLMSFRCTKGEYAVLGSFDFDEDEVISDGTVVPQPVYEKVDDAASAELLRLLCESPDKLQRLPAAQTVRAKPKASELPLDPVPAEVPAALKEALDRAAGGAKALPLGIRRATIETVSAAPSGKNQNVDGGKDIPGARRRAGPHQREGARIRFRGSFAVWFDHRRFPLEFCTRRRIAQAGAPRVLGHSGAGKGGRRIQLRARLQHHR